MRLSKLNVRECISRAVSEERIFAPLSWPSCKCASMNLHMSLAEADTLPAGNEFIISNGPGGDDANP
jgi:hypothetical protein